MPTIEEFFDCWLDEAEDVQLTDTDGAALDETFVMNYLPYNHVERISCVTRYGRACLFIKTDIDWDDREAAIAEAEEDERKAAAEHKWEADTGR